MMEYAQGKTLGKELDVVADAGIWKGFILITNEATNETDPVEND